METLKNCRIETKIGVIMTKKQKDKKQNGKKAKIQKDKKTKRQTGKKVKIQKGKKTNSF